MSTWSKTVTGFCWVHGTRSCGAILSISHHNQLCWAVSRGQAAGKTKRHEQRTADNMRTSRPRVPQVVRSLAGRCVGTSVCLPPACLLGEVPLHRLCVGPGQGGAPMPPCRSLFRMSARLRLNRRPRVTPRMYSITHSENHSRLAVTLSLSASVLGGSQRCHSTEQTLATPSGLV